MPQLSNNKVSKLQQWLENIWYLNGTGRLLLMPFSALYCAVNAFQRKTQRKKLKINPPNINLPIIVVGNITVGGTGKTPMTVYLVKLLKNSGYKPAIITRGYGGDAQSWPQKVTAESLAEMVGDEAVLMASRTNVPVYAGANRLVSIEKLQQETDCDVIISDDGMQHYKMPRDIQIAVIDGERGLGNGYCLPAGPLREPIDCLEETDLIVINGESKTDNPLFKLSHTMSLSAESMINLVTGEIRPLNDFSGMTIEAMTGIGNPKRFFTTLEKYGLYLNQHLFPDHHAFSIKDLQFKADSTVIMTEKDAVKCKALLTDQENYWYLPISAVLTKEFDQKFLALLEDEN